MWGEKAHERGVSEKIKQCEKDLMCQKTIVFILRKKGICGVCFYGVGKGVSERSGLVLGWDYAHVGLFTTLNIFSINWKNHNKNNFWHGTMSHFYSTLDHSDINW